MNAKSLYILVGATLVVVLVTVLTLQSRSSAVRGSSESAKLFPELLPRINDVAMVEIARKDGSATLKKNGNTWGLVQKSDYAVDMEPMRKMLIALGELTTVEPKTSDPARYEQLGVQDFGVEGSSSAQVTLKDSSGAVLANLIVGKTHAGKGGLGADQVYVRKSDEAQSWLVKGSLDLKEKAVDWLDKEILKIPRDRVRSILVTHPPAPEGSSDAPGEAGEIVRVDRDKPEDANFTLHDIPEGKELTYPTVAGAMANALEWINLEDVVPAGDVDFAQAAGPMCRFETFDGLVLTVKTKDVEGKTYARFEATYQAPAEPADPAPDPENQADAEKKDEAASKPAKKTPEEVQKEVAELNQRLSPWAFVIPAYNRSTFAKRMGELVKDKAPPPASTPGGEGGDEDAYLIPSDLPPEIQQQIKEHQESLGHETKTGPPSEGAPESTPSSKPAQDPKPPQ